MAELGSYVPTLDGTSWVARTAGSFPGGALIGGSDDGNDLYVVRSEHNGALIPGKMVPSHGVAYVAWGGEEHSKETYEVLVAPEELVRWVPSSNGAFPASAIPGGISEDGEILYIGRTSHEGSVTVGKVQPSHSVIYISYGGVEIAYPNYEILIMG